MARPKNFVRLTSTTRGGSGLRRVRARAKSAQGKEGVKVGFFATARYPDRTPVTNVAAWNQYGTKRAPARPFMTIAASRSQRPVRRLLAREVNPQTMVVDEMLAKRVGETVKSEIQETITDLRNPPNSPRTIRRKRGKTNPLIDTGFMRMSATYQTF